MPSGNEGEASTRASRARMIAVLLLCALGFALTLYVFYPGVMTFDARYVYADIAKHFAGDWQSPVMTKLWALIDPIAPGSASIFLLIATTYWLAFTLLASAIATRSWSALALPLLALSPPAFVLVGIIWRDVLFASIWLLAAALVFVGKERTTGTRYLIFAVVLALLAFGVLLRPNALPAAPILAAYILWPTRWRLQRALLIYLPALIVLYALIPSVYYGLLGAARQNPLHSIMVFDLGGITHFSKQNQFPVSWAPEEEALLTGVCYQPSAWDYYWTMGPCKFVMARLETEKIFGSPQLVASWRQAMANHPIAYLQHRMTFMATFLGKSNLTMWTYDLNDTSKVAFPDNAALMALKSVNDTLQPTFLFRQGTWLLLCIGLCALAWRQREVPEGAFVLGVCGSAAIYVSTYFLVGVASDYRYSYWAVLAGLSSGVVLLPRLFTRSGNSLSDIA